MGYVFRADNGPLCQHSVNGISRLAANPALAGLRAILTAERLKRERLDGLSAFVREMQKAL